MERSKARPPPRPHARFGLRFVGVVLLAWVAFCAGLFALLVDVLRPDPADPSIVHARVPRVRSATVAPAYDPGTPVPTAGFHVYGHVRDPDGNPIADAEVMVDLDSTEDAFALQRTQTDDDGAYDLRLTGAPTQVLVSAHGYDNNVVTDPDGTDEFEVDVVLQPDGKVRVWCAGLTDDDCGDIPMMCTSPLLFFGEECSHHDDGETVCECPDGEAAVRGGGRAARVEPGQREVWLDFRDAAQLTGRLVRGGAPVSECKATAIRIPTALEDLPRGMMVARQVDCGEDGRFAFEGLVAGDWELTFQVFDAGTHVDERRTLAPRTLHASEDVDIGDVDLNGGGGIRGVVVDGLTGEPVPNAPVLALREGVGDDRATTMATRGKYDGTFEFQGLPPGEWTVAHPLSPQDGLTVVVRDGSVTTGVEIATSDATALQTNGFELTEDEGDLVVSDVSPDSPADLAGLLPGDRVTGVKIGGFDLPGALGRKEGTITRMLLGHYDGPGVTLKVEREDGEEEVPLDW